MITINDVLVSCSISDIKNGVVNIPDGVTSIGGFAFYDCNGLTSIKIPDSVTSIGEFAFYGCNDLTSVTIGNGVKSIGNYAFAYCDKLTSITIPDGVTSIEERAFCACCGLTSVNIGNGVTSIGDSAFSGTNLISSTANYKAFRLKSDKLFCRRKEYREGVKHRVYGKLKLCGNGIHYCTNLFDIFNYYSGEIDKDIAIYEIEVGNKVLKDGIDSKCCTNSCVLKKRLYREDIINILNKGATNND